MTEMTVIHYGPFQFIENGLLRSVPVQQSLRSITVCSSSLWSLRSITVHYGHYGLLQSLRSITVITAHYSLLFNEP